MAVGGTAIRGTRIGSGPMGEKERGELAARLEVSYWCQNGHESRPSFAADIEIEIPVQWECQRCGLPAGLDEENPPQPGKTEVYKTHLAYVKERRTEADGEALLDEALAALRKRRGQK